MAEEKKIASIPYAVPLFAAENSQNSLPTPHKIIPENNNYQSTDHRLASVNEIFNGFDILTLTLIIRLGDQVFYHLFTNEMPLTDWLNEHIWAAALFCLLALIKVYCTYQAKEAEALKNSPSKLAQVIRPEELNDEKQWVAKIQEQVNFVMAHNPDLQERYAHVSVQEAVDENGETQVCLVPEEREKKLQSTTAQDETTDALKPTHWRQRLAEWLQNNWKSLAAVASTVWAVFNFPAMVYWVEWGLRSIFKSGGLGIGFSTGLDPFFVTFGMVLPIAITLGMYAPKLFNYVNNKYKPTSKVWKLLDSAFYKPIPNKIQNKFGRFCVYILLGILNNLRACLGAVGVSLAAIHYRLRGTPVEKSETKKKAKIAEDMNKIMRQAVLVDTYQKAGVDLHKIPPPNPSSIEAETQETEKSTLDTARHQGSRNDPWWSLGVRFLRQTAVGYVFLEFTWWWGSDVGGLLYQKFADPTADISNLFANPTAGWLLLAGSILYGAASVANRIYEQKEQAIKEPIGDKHRARRLSWEQSTENLKQWKQARPAVVKQLEENEAYKQCPALDDQKYDNDMQLTSKPSWNGCDYYTLNVVIGWVAVSQTGFWIGRGLNVPGTANNPKGWLCHWKENFADAFHENMAILATCVGIAILYTCMTKYLKYLEQQDNKDKMLYSGDGLPHLALESAWLTQQAKLLEEQKKDAADSSDKNAIDITLSPKRAWLRFDLNQSGDNVKEQRQPLVDNTHTSENDSIQQAPSSGTGATIY